MSTNRPPRTLVAVSLKAYLGHAQTQQWLTAIAAAPRPAENTELVLLPAFTSLADARQVLEGTGIRWGAQDCFWQPAGPWTGEITPDLLRELGCSYVEVGHAERRRIFGEDRQITAHKAAAATAFGITPIICFGEAERSEMSDVLDQCMAQLDPVIAALPDTAAPPVLAYEPEWAIGAARPAEARHVNDVLAAVRTKLSRTQRPARLIYGGAAGPGVLTQLPSADGLFLGRYGHTQRNVTRVLAEANTNAQTRRRDATSGSAGRSPTADAALKEATEADA